MRSYAKWQLEESLMAGALDALEAASALINREGRITACCGRFANYIGKPHVEVVGRRGREFMVVEDRDRAIELMKLLWKNGESFALISSRPRSDGGRDLYESSVCRLSNDGDGIALSVIRPFRCQLRAIELDPRLAASKAGYVVDMGLSLADFAAEASMPVTCDLFRVAALAGLQEAGIRDFVRTTE